MSGVQIPPPRPIRIRKPVLLIRNPKGLIVLKTSIIFSTIICLAVGVVFFIKKMEIRNEKEGEVKLACLIGASEDFESCDIFEDHFEKDWCIYSMYDIVWRRYKTCFDKGMQ